MGQHDEKLTFRAPDSLIEQLEAEAEERGVSTSKLVRFIVGDHLDFDLVEHEKQRIERLYEDLDSDPEPDPDASDESESNESDTGVEKNGEPNADEPDTNGSDDGSENGSDPLGAEPGIDPENDPEENPEVSDETNDPENGDEDEEPVGFGAGPDAGKEDPFDAA